MEKAQRVEEATKLATEAVSHELSEYTIKAEKIKK